MPEPPARARFRACVAAEPIDLAETTLWIAAEEYPSLDVGAYLAALGELARGGGRALAPARSVAERIERLNRFLFVERGFAGNREHYEDPRNSFLNEVLDRRRGIPITLAIVYLEVARRLDLDVRGISFPGHFLVKWIHAGGETPVDPFDGVVLSPRDCQARLRAVLGDDAALDPAVHLRAAAPGEILVRVLTNLKLLYLRGEDYARALGCCERILLLAPDAPTELRDRGLVLDRLDCFGAAVADLERFLLLAPDDPSAPAVASLLPALRERVRRLH